MVNAIGPMLTPVEYVTGVPAFAFVKLKLLPGTVTATRASADRTDATAVAFVSLPHTPLTVKPHSNIL